MILHRSAEVLLYGKELIMNYGKKLGNAFIVAAPSKKNVKSKLIAPNISFGVISENRKFPCNVFHSFDFFEKPITRSLIHVLIDSAIL